ncbi:MAG: 50S ribosomal protein L23 [Elusimicrobia bacterium]|nr:50S ribosomal protein L23 [Elusimicrobiota bacterium]
MKDLSAVIIGPLVTEKNAWLKEKENKYVLKVNIDATKEDIKKAAEKMFKVKVTGVNTMRVGGKTRRMGRFSGKRSDWKKAFISLKAGETIKFFEGA